MSRIIYSVEALIVNTICVDGNTGNIHIRGRSSVTFIGADYNRCSWNVHGGYQNRTSANKGEGVQILVNLWERNNAERGYHNLIHKQAIWVTFAAEIAHF